jgi:hypothetical protein
MRKAKSPGAGNRPSAASMASRVNLLIGDRRRLIVAVAGCSILSGFTEAATLAIIAQLATSLIKGAKHVDARIGPAHVSVALGTLIEIAAALTFLRIVLQVPLSILPARIRLGCAGGCSTRSRAPRGVCSHGIERGCCKRP